MKAPHQLIHNYAADHLENPALLAIEMREHVRITTQKFRSNLAAWEKAGCPSLLGTKDPTDPIPGTIDALRAAVEPESQRILNIENWDVIVAFTLGAVCGMAILSLASLL